MLYFTKHQGEGALKHLVLGKANNLGLDWMKYILVEHKFPEDFTFPTTWKLSPTDLELFKSKLKDPFSIKQFEGDYGSECVDALCDDSKISGVKKYNFKILFS